MAETIENFEQIRKHCDETITEMRNHIVSLAQKKVNIDKEIKNKTALIEEYKQKLEPLFNELSNFYKKQGIIKIIKK